MYIVKVGTKEGTIKGVALQNEDGTIAIITGVNFRKIKKWFRKTVKISYNALILTPAHYLSYTILEELGSYEKTCVYQILNQELKEKFSEFYRNELLKMDLFWNKTKLFIEEQKLSLTELSVIHELFRDGYAKENIVGLELKSEGKRVSFNLTNNEGIQKLKKVIGTTVLQAENVSQNNITDILGNISLQLKKV